MPVFHSYKNKSGYYITARPSDVGNITYQIRSEAEDILTDLGYGDEEDLPWGLINPLRSAGLVYTQGQGTVQEPADAPELDPSKLPQISEDELQELFTFLKTRDDISEEIFNRLKSKIETDKTTILKKLEDAVDAQIPNQETNVYFERTSNNDKIQCIRVELVEHNIEHDIDNRFNSWNVYHGYNKSWENAAKLYESRPKIMKALAQVEDELPFEKPFYNTGCCWNV